MAAQGRSSKSLIQNELPPVFRLPKGKFHAERLVEAIPPQRSAGRQTGVLDLSHPVVTTGGCVGISVNTNTAAAQSTKAHVLIKLTLDLLASKGAGT